MPKRPKRKIVQPQQENEIDHSHLPPIHPEGQAEQNLNFIVGLDEIPAELGGAVPKKKKTKKKKKNKQKDAPEMAQQEEQ